MPTVARVTEPARDANDVPDVVWLFLGEFPAAGLALNTVIGMLAATGLDAKRQRRDPAAPRDAAL